jgi:hypothetical protein
LENGSSRHPHVLRTADTTRTHYVSEVGQGSQLILCSVKLKSSSKVPVASCLPQHQDVAMGNGLRVGLWGKGLKNRHWQDRKLRVPRNGLYPTDGCHGPPLAEGQPYTATRTQPTLSLQWTGLSLSFAHQRWAVPEVGRPSYSLPLPGLLE